MPVMIVRRRPTTQRALTWTGTNLGEAREFLGTDFAGINHGPDGTILLIWTREHRHTPFEATPGYILMEGATRGEHWAVDDTAFTDTYRTAGAVRRLLDRIKRRSTP